VAIHALFECREGYLIDLPIKTGARLPQTVGVFLLGKSGGILGFPAGRRHVEEGWQNDTFCLVHRCDTA
jgi:hypothetical protein